jgi:hypothetical protein
MAKDLEDNRDIFEKVLDGEGFSWPAAGGALLGGVIGNRLHAKVVRLARAKVAGARTAKGKAAAERELSLAKAGQGMKELVYGSFGATLGAAGEAGYARSRRRK